jgi:hypothetical protein
MTNLNNESMKTVVETFIIEETQELIYDNEKLDQWNGLVSSLGLKGQAKICAPQKSPIPFLPMKDSMARVLETLCPRKVAIEDYDKTPIPVEILSLVSLSVKESYFNKIEIWYDDKDPDPACVGVAGVWYSYDKTWNRVAEYKSEAEAKTDKDSNDRIQGYHFQITQQYLIGRWADVKMSLMELTKKAKALFMGQEKNRLLTDIKEKQRHLDDLELEAERRFGQFGTNADTLSF